MNGVADKCVEPEPAKLSVAWLTMKNDNQGTDQTSALPNRSLKFTKKLSSSLVKVTYADNLHVYGNGNKWCHWTIKIDGKDCAIPIYNTKHTSATSDRDFAPHAIVGTCAGINAGNHTMTIALTRSNNADCHTGWSAVSARDAFFMEAVELNPAGQITTVMRKVAADGRDSGVVTGRSLKFDKRTDASQLRITWATNLRSRARNSKGGSHCDWELQIDQKSCSQPSKIGVSMHSKLDDNDLIPVEVVGWCQGIARGPHTLSVYVKSWNANYDCYTGWSTHDYMEVWEPTPAEQSMVTYMQKVSTDNGADSTSSVLSTSFTKQSSSSSVRILYYDNLRVVGHKKWCRWEVKVDGKSCTAPLAGSVHTLQSDNDYYPATIVGECLAVAAGKHNVNVAITQSGGADCHTGWTPGLKVMHALIEVQEVGASTQQPECSVANSNKKPGNACACAPGYWGKITWDVQPTGSCTSACVRCTHVPLLRLRYFFVTLCHISACAVCVQSVPISLAVALRTRGAARLPTSSAPSVRPGTISKTEV